MSWVHPRRCAALAADHPHLFAAAPAASPANYRRPCLPTCLMPACSVLGLAAVSLTATLHLPQWSLLHDAAAQVRRQLPRTAQPGR